MLAIIYWQYQLIKEPNKSLNYYRLKNITPSIRYPLLAVILITILQMGLGGWTSSHYAGLACPDLPQCQGQWWPETVHGPFHAPMVDAQQYLGGLLPMADRMAIQILHRLTACLLILSAFLLCYRMYNSPHRKLIGFILIPLTLQVFIGIGNVFLLLPLSLALLHNTGAALFWLCLWTVYFSILKAEVRNA
jgi:cytochrome c oxidase assembly protein subunit 15